MQILQAKTAGFCFGVKKAVERTIQESKTKKIVTLGPIIHNRFVIEEMNKNGVTTINNLDELNDTDSTVIIRSHGVAPKIYKEIQDRCISFYDCTCPFVSKIQKSVEKEYKSGSQIIILGDLNHPEIIGINGYAENTAIIINSIDDCIDFISSKPFDNEKKYYVVVQTTFNINLFNKIADILRNGIKNIFVNNTICDATKKRQIEADELSNQVDYMIVLGDKKSSNSRKLYEICKKNQEKTFFVESINEIVLNIFSANGRIGITAGASTPPAIIKEAIIVMSEYVGTVNGTNENENAKNEANGQSFAEMLALDGSRVTLHNGEVVKGTVISVVNGEVNVNLGFKSDGIIQKGEFSEDPSVDPSDVVKPGDEIEVFVVRVNDKEGNVLLSRRRIQVQRGMVEIEEAAQTGAILSGRISEVVKGGVIAIIKGTRAFVPSTQVSNRYIENLESLIGSEYNFQILQFDKSKRRIVAGRKELAAKEIAEKKEKIFASIEQGQKLEGTVSRIVDFGAFVDIGGVDGLIHISQLSWGRVKKVSSVLNEGDKVVVTVLEIDKEKEKISLTLKDIANDPWTNVEEKYPVGSIVKGKVVRMVSFGAFVELAPGLDGLVHISQIADKHVVKPDDVLSIGEEIEVKVTDVNTENKRISLSKKAADGVKIQEEQAEDESAINSENKTVDEATDEARDEATTAESTDTVIESNEPTESATEEATKEATDTVTEEAPVETKKEADSLEKTK